MKANGLTLKKMNSMVDFFDDKPVNELKTIVNDTIKHDAFVVAWLDYEVQIGRYQASNFSFYHQNDIDIKHIKQMRIFNINEELFIWRSQNVFKARLRKDNFDNNNKCQHVILAKQVLCGTRFNKVPLNNDSDFTEITEDSGAKLILPFQIDCLQTNDKIINRVLIQTHNYLSPNAIHQATYIDCRFVSFICNDKELK